MTLRRRILILDDDPSVLALLGAGLAAPDRHIESVSSGVAALRCVEAEPYDLVIADVEWIERIHRVRPDAKVVATAAASAPQNIICALRERAFTYIGKPFTLSMVGELVERALHSASWEQDIQVLSASPAWLELRMRCKLEAAERILQFLREMCVGLSATERENLAVAIREALLNAIEHGAGNDPEKSAAIAFIRTERAVLFSVRDPGKGFSFQKLDHAAVSNPNGSPIERAELRERLGLRPGGFGMLMARRLVDEMIYNEAGNEVLLIKYNGKKTGDTPS
jgi:anti-sigma regulatory factor (Ser/Thr protein kinase)